MARMVFACLLILWPFNPALAGEQDGLTMTYIANEGFLIEADGKKVLVDALFGKEKTGFCDVPPLELIKDLLSAKPPFHDVGLLVVTHDHIDHFDEAMVMEYMKNNTRCELVTTDQTVARLARCNDYETIKGRVHGIVPPAGSSRSLSLNGIELKVLRLRHCTYYETDEQTGEKVDRHRNRENIGVVLHLGDQKVLHIGDSALDDLDEYMKLGLVEEAIDVAMLGSIFWPPFEKRIKVFDEAIQAKSIVAMHLDEGNKERYFRYRDAIQDRLPPIAVFEKAMERKVFEKKEVSDRPAENDPAEETMGS